MQMLHKIYSLRNDPKVQLLYHKLMLENDMKIKDWYLLCKQITIKQCIKLFIIHIIMYFCTFTKYRLNEHYLFYRSFINYNIRLP